MLLFLLGEEGSRIDPSIYDVRFAAANRSRDGNLLPRSLAVLDKPGMVESDGIEPTTSCLQSTRSTN